MRLLLAALLVLATPLAALADSARATELARKTIGTGVVVASDDRNLDELVDVGDVLKELTPPTPTPSPSPSPTASPTPLPAGLLISSTTSPNAVSQVTTQTLTFTFAQPVSGFDASDVAVVGATKGAFAGAGAVYTLALTGTGGTITATVAADATTGGNDPATLSNFYQDTWTIDLSTTVTMELIRIPAGSFTMGSPDSEASRGSDELSHSVTISADFYIGKTEVTQVQWLAVQGTWPGNAPSAGSGLGDSYPAHYLSYDNAQAFLTTLNTRFTEPGSFTLPTESQWEYACRAGTTTRFSFGDGLGSDDFCSIGGAREDNMWFCGNNTVSGTKRVAQKPANAWGLHDMHGNVQEWCADWYGATYPTGPVVDPVGADSGPGRVLRGGNWAETVRNCRSAARTYSSVATSGTGFRVVAVR